MPVLLPFTRWAPIAAACLLLVSALPAAAIDKAQCGLLLLHESGGAGAALARKLAPGCTVRTIELAGGVDRDLPAFSRDLRRRVQEMRQQGAQRVLVGGWGLAANVAMGYGAGVGDVDGVLVMAPEEQAGGLGALPELAGKLRQHSPVLWVLGSDDPQARRGEDFAFAKAPPHPHSRYVTVKADRKGTPDAAVKAALEWFKALD
jgi:dienelactone hydrolase